MPNEIYHRSNFGNPNAEGFGDVYYDHAATNKLYNHSDYYENSDGTDATLKDLNNKASIVLTPTAYSDGSLNTVIPPYQVLSELVTNGDFSNGTTNWTPNTNATLSVDSGRLKVTISGGSGYPSQSITTEVGKKYKVTAAAFIGTSSRLAFWTNADSQFRNLYADGSYDFTFVATSTSTQLRLYVYDDGAYGFWDNVSVKEIQEADFDFSRGSSATRVNEQGLVEDVQILSGELVQNGDFEQIGAEEVTNGNFDNWTDDNPDSWTVLNEDANNYVTQDGTYARIVSNDTASIQIKQTIFTIGKIYKVELDAVVNSGNVEGLKLNDATAAATIGYVNSTGHHTFYFKAAGTAFVINRKGGGDTDISIDNVSVKEVGQNWTFGTGWSIEDGKAVSDGSQTGSSLLQQASILTLNKLYKVSYDLTVDSGTIYVRLGFSGQGAIRVTSGSYTEYITCSGNTNFDFLASSTYSGSVDNVSIIEITDDTDLPRIDFTDGTGSLLLEPQRTNSLPYSEDFTQWTVQSGTTITSNTTETLSPSGQYNASKIVSNGSVGFYKQVAVTGVVSRSIYLKSVTGTVNVKLKDPALTVTTKTLSVTESWQRFELVESNGHASQSGLWVDDIPSSGIYVWGAQLEVGDYATSYIPTSGSTVTRSADVANNSGNADLFNDSEGVLYAEILKKQDDNDNFVLISINNSSDNNDHNTVTVGFDSDDDFFIRVKANNVIPFYTNDQTASKDVYYKIALSYKSGDSKIYINGNSITPNFGSLSDTFSFGSTLNNLSFDYDGNGVLPFYGNVKALAVFKEALSNDLLERLTGEGYESFRLLAEANNYTII